MAMSPTFMSICRHVHRAEFLRQVAGLLDQQRVGAILEAPEPEVAVAIARGLRLFAGLRVGGRDGRALGALVGLLVEHRAGDELLRQTDVVHPRLDVQPRLERLRLGDEFLEVLFFAEGEGPGGAGVGAARLGPAVVQQVRAERALLGDVERVVEVDDILVRTGRDAHLVAAALVGIDDHDAVVALVDGVHVARPRCTGHRRSAGRCCARR